MKDFKKTARDYRRIIKLNFREHRDNIPQILKLAFADLKKTYDGAALGWSWAIIKPVVTILVYWFAIEIGLKSGKPVNNYPMALWLIAGIVPWFYVSDSLNGGTECIRRYSYLVTKMKYPVLTIPTFTNLSRFIVDAILTIASIFVFWIAGYPPTIYLLQLPFYMLMMFLLFNAWSLFAGLVSAISKDFSNLVKSITMAVFWLSGILWNVANVKKNRVLTEFLNINPVTYICYGYRNCFINHIWFFKEPKRLIYFLIWYVIMVAFSLWAYRKLRKEIPDVLV